MTKLKLTIEFEYDEDIMHDPNEEGFEWFTETVLKAEGHDGLFLHSNYIGDEIGQIKVVEIERLDNGAMIDSAQRD